MANEIQVGVSLAVTKGLMAATRAVTGLYVTMTGNAIMHGVQSVGTSKEDLVLGDVATPGYVLLRNLDGTNFVLIGDDADNPTLKLKAGEVALFRAGCAALSCKADTAAVLLEYVVMDD